MLTDEARNRLRSAYPEIIAKGSLACNSVLGGTNLIALKPIETPHYGIFASDMVNGPGAGLVCIGKACSDRYLPHETEDILRIADAATTVFDGFDDKPKVSGYFREGHYLTITPSDAMRHKIKGAGKDHVFPRIRISASYKAQSITAQLGFYRDLCSNLVMLQTVSETQVKIRHNQKLEERMRELIAQFSDLSNRWSTVTDHLDQLAATRITLSDALEKVFPAPEKEEGRVVTTYDKRIRAIIRRLQEEQTVADIPHPLHVATVSGWSFLNAVQGYIQHTVSRKQSLNNQWDRSILAAKDPRVKAAEQLVFAAV